MTLSDLTIPTPDVQAIAYAFTPDAGPGPWPAAIMFMDGLGIRPAKFDMAQRLADLGYYVLLPDMYWRAAPADPSSSPTTDEERRNEFLRRRASTDVQKQLTDVAACLKFLADEPRALGSRVGVTGYCMGGAIALRAAALHPDQVVAAASFHGGGLATDSPDSPHLLADRIKAKVLAACADQDPYCPEAEVERLDAALKAAGVDAEVVIYRGAEHGFVPRDMHAYDEAAAERHWRELAALFEETLKAG